MPSRLSAHRRKHLFNSVKATGQQIFRPLFRYYIVKSYLLIFMDPFVRSIFSRYTVDDQLSVVKGYTAPSNSRCPCIIRNPPTARHQKRTVPCNSRNRRSTIISRNASSSWMTLATSVVDPDSPGSALILVGWIRIRVQEGKNDPQQS
jgi:hypothetical protein